MFVVIQVVEVIIIDVLKEGKPIGRAKVIELKTPSQAI